MRPGPRADAALPALGGRRSLRGTCRTLSRNGQCAFHRRRVRVTVVEVRPGREIQLQLLRHRTSSELRRAGALAPRIGTAEHMQIVQDAAVLIVEPDYGWPRGS